MHRFFSLLVAAVALFPMLLTASCAPSAGRSNLPMGSVSALPSHIHNAPARVCDSYRYAMANADALKNVPCYCGCGPLGHKDNYDCYIKSVNADGTFVFDDHALGCTICVDITQDVMRLTKAGKSPAEIRAAIVSTHSQSGPSNQ